MEGIGVGIAEVQHHPLVGTVGPLAKMCSVLSAQSELCGCAVAGLRAFVGWFMSRAARGAAEV